MSENKDTQETTAAKEAPCPVVRMLGKDLLAENSSKVDQVCLGVSTRMRELMKAENFSVLTGAGSSVSVLGPLTFSVKALDDGGWVREAVGSHLADYEYLLQVFRGDPGDGVARMEAGVEDFIHFLYQLQYVERYGLVRAWSQTGTVKVGEILTAILKALKAKCRTGNVPRKDVADHRAFLKRIISRPTNLKRTNLFTTNYDLLFERTMDDMGLLYVDGFVGGIRRFFQPQAFNYDYYYPASTTEGRVTRLERVLHFYKLHGSLNWLESKPADATNVYGIEKLTAEPEAPSGVLIYPTPMKEHETLGFPYSELMRRFAGAVQQPQSVLVTYGYGFGDAHINRIIFEALNIPSFQLVIVSYGWTRGIKMIWDQRENLPCVGFIVGKEYAEWRTFANTLLPDLPTIELEERYENRQAAAGLLRDFTVASQATPTETADGK